MSFFPFHAIGLQCNPFRALTDEEWAALAVLPADLQDAIERGVSHVQLLGPLGHGKTTRLLGLRARLCQAGRRAVYEYVPEGQSCFVSDPAGLDFFLLDEAQRLAPPERERLIGLRDLRLVLGSHEDLSPLFARRRLELATIRIVNDEGQLRTALERRLSYFALGRAPAHTLDSSAVAYLHLKFGGNIRAAEYFLYEVFQRFPPPGVITPAQLALLGGPALTSARAPG